MKEAGTSFFAAFDAMCAEKIEPLDVDTFLVVDTHWFTSVNCVLYTHRELIELAPSSRAACGPEGNVAHYLMMAGAHGGAAWTAKGKQYGQYEHAIGTEQANFGFDGEA